jgi:hypothetical protein
MQKRLETVMDLLHGVAILTLASTALLVAIIAVVGQPLAGQTRDLVGTVRAADDDAAIEGVSVQVVGFSGRAVTDSNGFFALARLSEGELSLVFERLGFATDTLLVPIGTDSVEVFLETSAVELAEIVVQTSAAARARQRFEQSAQASAITVDARDILRTPTVLEADVIRMIQLLPGTVAINDYTVGYNARGGEADQNLIQLDGITIFNPSHLGGLFSTFDAQAIGDTEYLTGGFPSHYSGRLSSVLDVRTRPGSREFGVMGQISLLSSKVLVEGSLPFGNSTFLVAGRRTYADQIIKWFTSSELPYYFGDAVAKLTFQLPTGGTLAATGYIGRDVLDWEFEQSDPTVESVSLRVNWGNRLLGLNYDDWIFGKPLELSASVTEFSTTVGLFPDFARVDNDARLLTVKGAVSLSPGRSHDVRVGGGIEEYRFRYDAGSAALSTSFLDLKYRPRILSAFIDDQWRPQRWLMIRPGLRMEAVGGGADVVTFSPRVALKALVAENFALTGSAGRYFQPIHSLRDHNSPWSFVDFWIGADSLTPVGRSDHLVLGFEQWFSPDLSLTVEGYRKTFNDILNTNVADDLAVRGDEFVTMTGDAYGLDVLLRKYAGNWTGWISYSFGKSMRQDPTQEFAPAHDRRHFLNIVVNGSGPLGSEMSLRWGFGSPLPYTQIVGQWEHRTYRVAANGFRDLELEPIADLQLNGRRYPHYSRLDVSFRWETGLWGGVAHPFLQFVNLYNRANVFLYNFDFTETPGVRRTVPQLPFLPSFGMEFEF